MRYKKGHTPWNKGLKFSFKAKKHGMCGTRFYKIWGGMKGRCNHKKTLYYKNGIKVCKRWMNFENFYNDMFGEYCDHRYFYGEENTTIERVNNNKGYSKSNCRWATYKEQTANRKIGWKVNYRVVRPKAKGCYYHKLTKKWCAQITVEGKQKHLGLYKTEKEAHNIYLKELNKILCVQ